VREGGKGEEEGVVAVCWLERVEEKMTFLVDRCLGDFRLLIFSKGGGRGASWMHIQVKLMKREG